MKKLVNILLTPKATLVLLLIFAVALGIATFIEERYDTITARMFVYSAKWFEVLMLLLAANFIGMIGRYKMLSRKKWTGLTFHLAFILLILGAGITRYFGFEGSMHIREGETSNVIFSSDPYLKMQTIVGQDTFKYEYKRFFKSNSTNKFHVELEPQDMTPIKVSCKSYISNAIERIVENVAGGTNALEVMYATNNQRESIHIMEGEIGYMGNVRISYNNDSLADAILVRQENGILTIRSPYRLIRESMQGGGVDTIMQDSATAFDAIYVFHTQDVSFIFRKFYPLAIREQVAAEDGEQGVPVLLLDVNQRGKSQEVKVMGSSGVAASYTEVPLDGMKLRIAYGDREIGLPFFIRLDDFILDRYAGSMSPSSYASEVTLIDERNDLNETHRISMNNVLDYKGYRFFQSSYDQDEKGTVLSVNHDFLGTWVSYLGYFLLGLGFILTLFNKNSRFRTLSVHIRSIRELRKAPPTVMLILLFGMGFPAFAQQVAVQKPVSSEHAERFGRLVVQTYDGRFEPVHTLATDVMHKISRKDKFDFPGKGRMSDVQVFLDIMMDGVYWQDQKIIYVREKSVRDLLGVQGKYAALTDFFDQQSQYRLAGLAETAFRKKQSELNPFDKEIIKLDERVNIFISLLNASILKVFPLEGSSTNRWISPVDSLAYSSLSGDVASLKSFLKIQDMTYNNIMRQYFVKIMGANAMDDYSEPDQILSIIEAQQRKLTPSDLLPSKGKIKLETFYNKANIFIQLKWLYALLSIILLVLTFAENLRSRQGAILDWTIKGFITILALAFLYHTFGMGLRWYLSGHAPWSNGYEALLLVAWGSLLAGFSFMRYSRITLAATVLLAFSMLMTASHSSYDPQLTNLQPVLKSYWLIIHVAAITISYGFLGLGFVLGLINLSLSLFKNSRTHERLNLIGQELTYINEMNLTIGLFLATIGTFLGGVWANESWGRYWGWDAKETWALIIVITYAMILHFRLIPRMKSAYVFNLASVFGFGSVIMTFIGVNYYLSKGLHSYASGSTPIFPIWAWVMILSIVALSIASGIKEMRLGRNIGQDSTGELNL